MKTHEQYIKQLSEMNPNLVALSEYKGALSPIKVKCLLCGYEWVAKRANDLIRKNCIKCLNCHNFIPDKNDTSYFSVAYPEFADWLVNKDEGFRFKKKSDVKTDWICPNCGEIVKQIPFRNIARFKHVPCKKCSDGVSYPNKVMYNLLTQLHVDFKPEYSPKWIAPKRYDFYIPSKEIIIEMDGAIGHGNKSFTGERDNNLLEIDKYKDSKAKEHNIEVIRIDAKESDIDYISKNIIASKMASFFDLSNIDWNLIEKESFSSLQMKAIRLWEESHSIPHIINELKLARITILKYLNKGAKNGMCSYDAKEQYHLSGLKNIEKAYSANRVKIVCLETGQVFESFREANKWLGYAETNHTIADYLKNRLQSAGKHPVTKEKLHWMYYEDYIKGVA